MHTFKDKVVNGLTDEERFDLITDGRLREPIYDFGTELVTADDMIYECEYLSDEKTLEKARMLWCRARKSEEFTILPEDPALEKSDDSYAEEIKLILPKLIEDGTVEFNQETGEYTISEDVKAEIERLTGEIDNSKA